MYTLVTKSQNRQKASIYSAFYNLRKHNFVNKPGWSDYVDDLYKASRDAFSLWRDAGQPRQGPLHELHKKTKARFKYALRFITKNEKQLRKEALAKKLTDLNPNAFWKEIKLMNKNATPFYLLIVMVLMGMKQ